MSAGVSELAREMVDSLDECRSLDELAETLIVETQRFGIDKLVGGVHRLPKLSRKTLKFSPTMLMNTLLFSSYPDEWHDRYLSEGFDEIDPVVRRIRSSNEIQGIPWTPEELYRTGEAEAVRVMNEARDFKLASGFTVSTTLSGGEGVAMSFVGSHALDLGPEDRELLVCVGTHTLHRAYLLAKQRENIGLTARQIQYLQLASHGLSDEDIANQMGITFEGARKYLKLIHRKLGANSKPNAVVIALRLGLIR